MNWSSKVDEFNAKEHGPQEAGSDADCDGADGAARISYAGMQGKETQNR